MPWSLAPASPTGVTRAVGRLLLGVALLAAGTAHLLVPDSFLAQVPPGLPAPRAIVYVSGVVELVLGLGLVLLPRWRIPLGLATALYLVVIFPGNVAQAVTGTAAFGLDTDAARYGRLLGQPLLVLWALWATAAWRDRHTRREADVTRG